MANREEVIRHLTEHRKQLALRRQELLKPLMRVEEDIQHITATINSLTMLTPRHVASDAERVDFPIAKLRGLTQVQALMVIAKHNDGIIRAQEAKRLLIRAGVMRETKNSTNVIHAVIIRSEKFERVRPGEYRLKEATPEAASNGVFHAPVQ